MASLRLPVASATPIMRDQIPDGFVLIRDTRPKMEEPQDKAPQRKEEALEIKAPLPTKISHLMRAARPSRARGGTQKGVLKPVTVNLAFSNNVNSSAATALAVSVGLNPSTTGDWTAWASLYDEVRVVGSTLHFRFNTSAVSAVPMSGVICYDPIEGSALVSLANGLIYPHHKLVHMAAGPTAQCSAPLPTKAEGWWALHAKVYTDTARNTTSTALTNGWMSTSDSSDIWGYWKCLFEAASSAVTVTFSYHCILTCEFRSRQ